MAQKLTTELMEKLSQTKDVTIPHFTNDEQGIIVTIKRIPYRSILAQYVDAKEKEKKEIADIIQKYTRDKSRKRLSTEEMKKIDPLVTQCIEAALVDPTMDTIRKYNLEFDILQKTILFMEIVGISAMKKSDYEKMMKDYNEKFANYTE